MSVEDKAQFFITSARVDNTRAYPGGLLSFLVTAADTHDGLSLFEAKLEPGSELPMHLHEERDVIFYVLEGEMEVLCEAEVRTARPGDTVFVPRRHRHTYRLQAPVRFLAIMQPSQGVEGYFKGLSQPVVNMELPAGGTSSPAPDPAFVAHLAADHGVRLTMPSRATQDTQSDS